MKTLILKAGAKGLDVVELQELLNQAGFKVVVDGLYDDNTAEAVRKAQASYGLVVDGQAGAKTLHALRNGGEEPRHLKETDLIAAAKRLGVPLASIKAVNQVETTGPGFLPSGRPVLLFERHVMYRQLTHAGQDAAAAAQRYPQVVSTVRGGYAGGTTEWHRFQTATQIDPACAIESASWGMFQIMGYHWQALGYASAADFLACMEQSEGQQLEAFVRFIEQDPTLHKALKARKWAEFARRYNGPAYADNHYDIKLERAYDRFSAGEKAAVPA